MRKRIKVEVVSSESRLQKLINRITFKYCTDFDNNNLTVVTLENKIIDFCKPIYVGTTRYNFFTAVYYLINIITGFAELDISKTLMYIYHYNVMKEYYKDAIHLMYTDTGITIIYFFIILLICFIYFRFVGIPKIFIKI
jgi:hypothetical protein